MVEDDEDEDEDEDDDDNVADGAVVGEANRLVEEEGVEEVEEEIDEEEDKVEGVDCLVPE